PGYGSGTNSDPGYGDPGSGNNSDPGYGDGSGSDTESLRRQLRSAENGRRDASLALATLQRQRTPAVREVNTANAIVATAWTSGTAVVNAIAGNDNRLREVVNEHNRASQAQRSANTALTTARDALSAAQSTVGGARRTLEGAARTHNDRLRGLEQFVA